MFTDDLINKVRRIYSAIDAVEENDLAKFTPKMANSGKQITISLDFSDGLDNEQLSNIAYSLIHNIANLKNPLKKWAANNAKDKNQVDIAFNNSEALKIIQDLSNNDKHGYPPRDAGLSGKAPKLNNIERFMQLSTGTEANSSVGVAIPLFAAQQKPQITTTGSGTAKVVITGTIIDKDGKPIGDLHTTALDAIKAWDSVLINYNIKI